MAMRYALKLGTGHYLKAGGAKDPHVERTTELQNARIYDSVSSAKMQQGVFRNMRKEYISRGLLDSTTKGKAFNTSCNIVSILMQEGEVEVVDNYSPEPTKEVPQNREKDISKKVTEIVKKKLSNYKFNGRQFIKKDR